MADVEIEVFNDVDINDRRSFEVTFGGGVFPTPQDPDIVFFFLRHKTQEKYTQYEYGPDPEIQRTAQGKYKFTYIFDLSGTYYGRFEGQGLVHEATEFEIHVRKSKVYQR